MYDLSRRYSELTFLTAHNAFANRRQHFRYHQQKLSIAAQLEFGVRALMLDIHVARYLSEPIKPKIRLCHVNCFLLGGHLLQSVLEECRDFLARNSEEVVTLFLESWIDSRNKELIMEAFEKSGTLDYVFRADSVHRVTEKDKEFWPSDNCPSNANSRQVCRDGWPQLRWMVQTNKRLVVFSEQKAGDDGWPLLWDYAVENWYGAEGMNPLTWARARAGSFPLNWLSADSTKHKPLFVMNHFPSFTASMLGGVPEKLDNYECKINNYLLLARHVYECHKVAERLPNFLAVDFVTAGINGGSKKDSSGPMRIVKEINSKRETWISQHGPQLSMDLCEREYLQSRAQAPAVATCQVGNTTLVVEVHEGERNGLNFELSYRIGRSDGPTIQWGESVDYAVGQRPAVAIGLFHGTLFIVMVHQSKRGGLTRNSLTLEYCTGVLGSDGIDWCGHPNESHIRRYDSGSNPAITFGPDGAIIVVYQTANYGDSYLWCRTASLPEDPRTEDLRWRTKPVRYDKGAFPSLASMGHLIVETHDGVGTGAHKRWYRIGVLTQDYTIEWVQDGIRKESFPGRIRRAIGNSGRQREDIKGCMYDGGKRPALAVDPTDMRIVEVHQSGDHDLWYIVGELDPLPEDVSAGITTKRTIMWGGSFHYDYGSSPAIAALGNGRFIEAHESPHLRISTGILYPIDS